MPRPVVKATAPPKATGLHQPSQQLKPKAAQRTHPDQGIRSTAPRPGAEGGPKVLVRLVKGTDLTSNRASGRIVLSASDGVLPICQSTPF